MAYRKSRELERAFAEQEEGHKFKHLRGQKDAQDQNKEKIVVDLKENEKPEAKKAGDKRVKSSKNR